jgi:putative PIN family toxin of toxin-antitoxin system
MKPWRVVLDTNIVVAALRSNQGASYQLLMLLGGNVFAMCLTVSLTMEYEAAAMRLVGATPLTRRDIADVLDYLCSQANRHKVHFLWRPFLSDPADDMVLEAAVASGAKYIVTHNTRDFAGAEKFGIRVLTPGDFLNAVRRRK